MAGLGRLPPGAARRLAGRADRADGHTLDPRYQVGLALHALARRPRLETLGPDGARAEFAHLSAVLGGAVPAGVAATRLAVPGPAGPLPALLFRPASAAPRGPLLVWLHGGGWVVGDVDTHAPLCARLAAGAGLPVLSVGYRLAPEHPFPAALDDARAAFAWAAGPGAAALGADPRRVALGGDSAGGNLTAGVARLAAASGGPVPALQVLLYPSTDLAARTPSRARFAEGYGLTAPLIDWFVASYLGPDGDPHDPLASPLRADDLRGLPPAWIGTAGFDPLRDEGHAYAARLGDAGVSATTRCFGDQIHGFAGFAGAVPSGEAALDEVAAAVRAGLGVT